MSNIKKAFENGKAFIAFVTCGDPDLDTTKEIIKTMAANGADLIELGIPFSDPTAEGPVIQGANLRALSGGITTDQVFEMVKEVRQDVDIPMVFMTYANVIYSYGNNTVKASVGGEETTGIELFAKAAKDAGMDGIILPDVPFEEKDEFASVFRKYDMDLVSLIAPTSENRIAMIAKEAEGFIYIVSSLGVTGMRSEITTDIPSMVKMVKAANPDVPCAIGFGISTPEQAYKMSRDADGVIVGSAIVNRIAAGGKDAIPEIGKYVASMKAACLKK